jgi:anti-anti-sigma factor
MTGGQVRSAHDRHALLVYQDRALRLDQLAAFAGRGLERGEVVLCTAASDDCLLDEGLAARGVEVAAARRAGRLVWLPLDELFSAGGMTEYVTRVLQRGHAGVRLCGDAATSTAHLGREAMQAAEQEMDHLCDALPVAALCQYDAVAGTPEHVSELVAAHRQVVRTDTLLLTRRGGEVHLRGEVDFAAAPVLEAALRQAAADGGTGSMVVDLTELTFIDIAGHHALMRGTDRLRAGGGSLVLRGASGSVLRVLDILGLRRRGDVLFI